MAHLLVANDKVETVSTDQVRKYLQSHGIDFGSFAPDARARELASQHTLSEDERLEILQRHSEHGARFRAAPGYRADVVCFHPELPHLHFIVNEFGSIHYHFEHEYWFFFDGAASFGFLGGDGTKFVVTVKTGEFLQVPEGRWQWFELTAEKRMKAMRFFYTDGRIPARIPVDFAAL